jgi:antitoxin CcdA
MRMSTQRKPSNLSLDVELVAEARQWNVNLSRAAEDGIRTAVLSEKARQWKVQNAEAINASNNWIAERGLPLAKQRMF